MKNLVKKIGIGVITLSLSFAIATGSQTSVQAAAKPKISTKKVAIYIGDTKKIKIKNANKNVKWSTSNKKVVKIVKTSGKKKSTVKVKALKKGSAKITAKVGTKKFTCKVTVKKSLVVDNHGQTQNNSNANSNNISNTNTSNGNNQTGNSGTSSNNTNNSKVADNLNRLKNYILNYGAINSSGDRFISWIYEGDSGTNIFGVVYEASTNKLQLILTSEYSSANTAMRMYLDLSNTNYMVSPEYVMVGTTSYIGFEAQTSFEAAAYANDTMVQFTIILGDGEDSLVQELCNMELQLAFMGWDELLKNQLGMTMVDIGFIAYK